MNRLFITADVEAELAAVGYEFERPVHVRTKSISELYGWQPREALSETVNRPSKEVWRS